MPTRKAHGGYEVDVPYDTLGEIIEGGRLKQEFLGDVFDEFAAIYRMEMRRHISTLKRLECIISGVELPEIPIHASRVNVRLKEPQTEISDDELTGLAKRAFGELEVESKSKGERYDKLKTIFGMYMPLAIDTGLIALAKLGKIDMDVNMLYASTVAYAPYVSRGMAVTVFNYFENKYKGKDEKKSNFFQNLKTRFGLYFPILMDTALIGVAWLGKMSGAAFSTLVAAAPYPPEGIGVRYDFKEKKQKEGYHIYRKLKDVPFRFV